MLHHLRFASLCLLVALCLPACASKTEVVALQPTPAPAKPQTVTHTTTVAVKKKNPAPSPWATDAVSAYDESNR